MQEAGVGKVAGVVMVKEAGGEEGRDEDDEADVH